VDEPRSATPPGRGLPGPISRFLEDERRFILDSVILGLVGAASARLFMWLLGVAGNLLLTRLAGYRPPTAPGEGGVLEAVVGAHGLWLVPLVTTLGGLVSGLLVYGLAPEAEGHGTDTAVRAFHESGGAIRARVSPIKMLASAITIGSGGSAGREGPTALISAGIGSIYANLLRRPAEERRLLVLIGMAAGLSAIFRSPIGTALFAVEVLYGEMDFEGGALAYTMLASIIAYAVNGLFVGWAPLFRVPAGLATPHVADDVWYVALGVAAGIVATAVPSVFYRTRDAFRRIPLPPHLKPALGGLGVGVIALALPQVLGGGYGWIQAALDGRLAIGLLAALVAGKLAAFALTVSSGGSGGVFAPTLFVGAMLGGLLADLFHQPAAAFVVIGMAAVFGGAARVPIATLLMVTEMTGGYELLVPAALAVMVAFLVQGRLSARLKYRSLYEAQVPGRSDSPAHNLDYVEVALKLLDERKLTVPAGAGSLDLRAVLASGVPVDLADGTKMMIGALRADSPLAGKRIRDCFPQKSADSEIAAVYRRGHTLLPHAGLVLRPKDRLLLIATEEGRRRLAPHLAGPGPERATGTSRASRRP
jgi:CIC family chloride channel protein